jgi:hypothetical protein
MMTRICRAAAMSVRALLLSASLLAAGVAVLAPTQTATAQMGMMGGGGTDQVTRRGVNAYAKILGFDETQKETALTLLEASQAESKVLGEEMQAKNAELMQRVSDGEGFGVFQKEMPDLVKGWTERAKKIEGQFFEDLKMICTPEQLEKFDRVERHRRRETGMRFGMMSGSATDLVAIAERSGAAPKDNAEYDAAVQQYESVVDRQLKDLERTSEEMQTKMMDRMKEGGAMAFQDPNAMTDMMKPLVEVARQLRDTNREHARKMGEFMTPELREKFEAEVAAKNYPRIYREPHLLKQAREAGAMELSSEQRERLEAARAAYLRDAAPINEKWAKAVDDQEEKMGGTMGVMMQSWRSNDQGGDNPLGEARKARRELDKATEDKIKEILTSDQFAKLTPKPPANPNPWADMMPSEEEE